MSDQADDFQQHTGYSESIVEEELFHFDDSDDFQLHTGGTPNHHGTNPHHHQNHSNNQRSTEIEPESPMLEEVIIDNVKQVDESEECILDEDRRPKPLHLFSSSPPPAQNNMKTPTNINSPPVIASFANHSHHSTTTITSPTNSSGVRSPTQQQQQLTQSPSGGSTTATPTRNSPSSSTSQSASSNSAAMNITPINFNSGVPPIIGSPSKGITMNNNSSILMSPSISSKESDILNLTPINIKTLPSSSTQGVSSTNTPSSMTPIHGTSTSNIGAALLSSSPIMLGSAMHQIMEQQQQQQHQSPTNTSPRLHIPKKEPQPQNSPTTANSNSVQATPGSPQSKRKFSNGTPGVTSVNSGITTTTAASNSSTTTTATKPSVTPSMNNSTPTSVVSTPTSSGLANSIGSAISSIASTLTASLSVSSTNSTASNSSSSANVDKTVTSPSSIPINHHNLRPLTDCCETHKDQKLNTWCHTCGDELICAICAISKHKGHDCDLVEEVYQKEKQELKNQIFQMQQNISDKMEKLARDKGTISHTYEDGLKSINENFDLLEKKLAQKRKELTEKWKICCEDEICEKILNSGMQQLSQIKFLTDGFMENLSKMDLAEFIQSKTKKSLLIPVLVQQFQENLRKIDRSYLSDTLDICVNFDSMKDIVESIDKIGAIGPKNAHPHPTSNVTSNVSSSSCTSSPSVHSSPNTPVIPTQEIKCKIEGKFVSSFGGKGTEDGQFSSPTDIAIDPNDNIIICDNENNRVQIFDKHGKFVRKFSVTKPYGVTFDAKEGVILVTSDDHCVYAFDKSGTEVGKFGSKGSDYGHFSYPTGIIVSETKSQVPGKIIVCDHHNHRIQMFDKYGSFLKSFGTNGTSPEMDGGYFYGPNSLDIDIDGNLVITDRYNSRVQVFTLDGTFVRKFSVKKQENSECDPTGICCLKKNIGLNYAAICDYANNRIQIWNLREGVLIKQFGCYGSEDGQFDGPNGVSITSEGHLVVVDYHNHRVQIFK